MASKPKYVSLRRKREFDQLRLQGRLAHPSPWLMASYLPNDFTQIRCGWTVPRYVGNAAVRNKLKRWGREYLRKWAKQNELSVDLNIIFKRRDAAFYRELTHVEFDRVFDHLFSQLLKKNLRHV